MKNKLTFIKRALVCSLLGLFTLVTATPVQAMGTTTTQLLPNTGEEIAKTAIIGGLILVALVLIVLYLRRKKQNDQKK